MARNEMTLPLALARLRGRDDWEAVIAHVAAERDGALTDFQSGDLLDSPQKLARLSGEIGALDRLWRIFSEGPDPT